MESAIIGMTTASRRSRRGKDGHYRRGLSSESVGNGIGGRGGMGAQEKVAELICRERRVAIGGIVGQLVGAHRGTNGKKGRGSIRVEGGSWNRVDRRSGFGGRSKACVEITASGSGGNGTRRLRQSKAEFDSIDWNGKASVGGGRRNRGAEGEVIDSTRPSV
jgi:hypothetical protein